MALRETRIRVTGTVSRLLQYSVAGDIDALVGELLNEALRLWSATGWHRANDAEASCTVRVVNFMRQARRGDDRFFNIAVEYEATELTAEMLDGLVPPVTARRPDLRLSIGEVTARRIECKRLDELASLPKEYVLNGMNRFVRGAYGPQDPQGYMIGYTTPGSTTQKVVDRINLRIDLEHGEAGNRLQETVSTDAWKWYESRHVRNSGQQRPYLIRHVIVPLE